MFGPTLYLLRFLVFGLLHPLYGAIFFLLGLFCTALGQYVVGRPGGLGPWVIGEKHILGGSKTGVHQPDSRYIKALEGGFSQHIFGGEEHFFVFFCFWLGNGHWFFFKIFNLPEKTKEYSPQNWQLEDFDSCPSKMVWWNQGTFVLTSRGAKVTIFFLQVGGKNVDSREPRSPK